MPTASNRPRPRRSAEIPSNNPPLRIVIGFTDSNEDREALKPVRVAQGGMARVYICPSGPVKDLYGIDGPYVAIKKIREFYEVPLNIEKITREAYLWLLLGDNPNITRLLNVAWGGDTPSLTMEYIDDSLRDVIDRAERMNFADAVDVALDVANALEYCRNMRDGFVHGDIKPENILITSDGTAKLSDFGLARASGVEAGFGGTALYMAPEVILSQEQDIASDLYSLGCVIYETLTGVPPFGLPNSENEDYLVRHVRQAVPGADGYPRNTPAKLIEFTSSLLAKDPTKRPSLSATISTLASFSRKKKVQPNFVQPTLRRTLEAAEGLGALGYLDEAIDIYEQIIQRTDLEDRERASAYLELAVIYLQAGKSELGVDLLSRTEAILENADLDSNMETYLKGQWHYATGLYKYYVDSDVLGALPDAKIAVELISGIGAAHELLINCYMQLKDWPAALEASKQAFAQAPTIVRSYEKLIMCAIMADDPHLAFAAADRAVESWPQSGHAHALRAMVMINLGARSDNDIETFFREDAPLAVGDSTSPPHMVEPIISFMRKRGIELRQDSAQAQFMEARRFRYVQQPEE